MDSPGPPVSSINKTDHPDITEILLKVALNTINPTNQVNNFQLYHDEIKLPFYDEDDLCVIEQHSKLYFIVLAHYHYSSNVAPF